MNVRTKSLRIANGAGFLGDNIDAPRRIVEHAQVDYLTLEYLAELTLSILARLRQKDPSAGYADDFLNVLRSLCTSLRVQGHLKIVTNAGGMNPQSCARAAAKILATEALEDLRIGVVTGDDLLPRLEEFRSAGCEFQNLDTGEPLSNLKHEIVSANVYLGAQPIADALDGGARLVITGRVADASLTVGPAVHEFGWKWNDWNRLAGASVAGHLIECGAQVTGGLYRHWQSLDLAVVGYPIAELAADAGCVITKPEGTGGCVSQATVIEQLVYEIGNPTHYLTPDVDVDFTTVEVNEIAKNRIAVHGATGRPATDTYKVSLAYHDGYTASGQLLIFGEDCISKARACGEMILRRVELAGFTLRNTLVETLGAGEAVPGLHRPPESLREVMLRVTVDDSRRDAVERFTKEFAPLVTSGPPGIAGYASGRPMVRPVFAYWPTLAPKSMVTPCVEVRSAKEWLS
jgi:hypothetical protein